MIASMSPEEWCQSMKKMDQKMKRACKKIPATSDQGWTFHNLGMGLRLQGQGYCFRQFCAFKSCQHGMLDFCWTDCRIISYAATRGWMDAATLVATI